MQAVIGSPSMPDVRFPICAAGSNNSDTRATDSNAILPANRPTQPRTHYRSHSIRALGDGSRATANQLFDRLRKPRSAARCDCVVAGMAKDRAARCTDRLTTRHRAHTAYPAQPLKQRHGSSTTTESSHRPLQTVVQASCTCTPNPLIHNTVQKF